MRLRVAGVSGDSLPVIMDDAVKLVAQIIEKKNTDGICG